jgi:hypothetical protein
MRSFRDNPRPLIILGMHRSGTSMLARMLETCGLFVGATLEENHEPPLFRKINDRLLALAGASWTQPQRFLERLNSSSFVDQCRGIAETMLSEGFGKHFLGLHGPRKLLGAPIVDWGWKEPRTCLTLPVWRAIYPEARYAHIVRHPLDVALSLRARQERKERAEAERWSHPECLDMERNLRLWELYVGAACCSDFTTETPRHGEDKSNAFLDLRYEDLLENPSARLREVTSFACMEPSEDTLQRAAATAVVERVRRFKKGDPVDEWTALVRAMPEARRYGYD